MRQAERDEAEGWAARERVGRGWTEREVWAEPVWRGLGRSVGELGRAEVCWAGFEFGAGFSSIFLFLCLPNSNQIQLIEFKLI